MRFGANAAAVLEIGLARDEKTKFHSHRLIPTALGTHQVNTVYPVAAFEIMHLIAHLFYSSRVIRPQYMRKVGFHTELF